VCCWRYLWGRRDSIPSLTPGKDASHNTLSERNKTGAFFPLTPVGWWLLLGSWPLPMPATLAKELSIFQLWKRPKSRKVESCVVQPGGGVLSDWSLLTRSYPSHCNQNWRCTEETWQSSKSFFKGDLNAMKSPELDLKTMKEWRKSGGIWKESAIQWTAMQSSSLSFDQWILIYKMLTRECGWRTHEKLLHYLHNFISKIILKLKVY
jgi:hypothetical protein